MRKILRPLVSFAVFAGAACIAPAAADAALEVTVVGQTDSTYKRKKLSDGTFKPEGYAIINGGVIPGTIRDETLEKVRFPQIAEVVGRHLAAQKYFLAEKAGDFDLLIVLHWGCTNGFDNVNYSQSTMHTAQGLSTLNRATETLANLQQAYEDLGPIAVGGPGESEDAGKIRTAIEGAKMEKGRAMNDLASSLTMTGVENNARDSANLDNAKILGYLDAINARRNVLSPGLNGVGADLLRDVEEKRYFVVVSAYDFRTMRDKKKKVLRWVTRISIRAGGNRFDERMAQMVAAAAKALGQKNDLSRQYYGDPRVQLGETEYLGVATPASLEIKEKPPKTPAKPVQ